MIFVGAGLVPAHNGGKHKALPLLVPAHNGGKHKALPLQNANNFLIGINSIAKMSPNL